METWQLQEAKNKLSEVVDKAIHDGPQMITRHGRPAVVVMSVEQHEKMEKTSNKDFVEFLLSMPKMPEEWYEDGKDPFKRIDAPAREIDW